MRWLGLCLAFLLISTGANAQYFNNGNRNNGGLFLPLLPSLGGTGINNPDANKVILQGPITLPAPPTGTQCLQETANGVVQPSGNGPCGSGGGGGGGGNQYVYYVNGATAGCNGSTPGTSFNIAPTIDAAVLAGFTDIVMPPNCLYIPDSNTTAADVTIEGTDWQTSVIASSNTTAFDVMVGARGTLKNIDIVGLFCYQTGGTNVNRRCPTQGFMNATNASAPAGVYSGSGWNINTGTVTYNGVTTASGGGPQGLVVNCASEDCIITQGLAAAANPLRLVATADVAGTIKALQYTSDTQGVVFSINKYRGTPASPQAIQVADNLWTVNAFGYDGTNAVQAGSLFIRSIGSVGTNDIPGAFGVSLANTGGSLTTALFLNGTARVLQVGGSQHTIADFDGNLYTAGYTVANLPPHVGFRNPAAGEHAYVTDATSCSGGQTPTGGGSTPCYVWYTGSAWVAVGGASSGGLTGTVNSGSSPSLAQYQGSASTTVGPATVSGDCTMLAGGAMTCLSTNGVAFGAMATASQITAAEMLTLTDTNIYVGNSSNRPVSVALSGDCTLLDTGAVTCLKTNGTAFSALATETQITAPQMLTLTNHQLYQGNGSNQPASVTLSAAIDAAIGSTRGSILERGSGGWVLITPGTSGYALFSNGAGADPTYQAVSQNAGSGTINSGSSPAIAMYQGSASTTVGPVTVSGDCSIISAGTMTCLKTNGSSFGTLATENQVTAGQMLGLNSGDIYVGNGSNNPADVPLSGDCTMANTGAITCTKTSGVAFSALATASSVNAAQMLALANNKVYQGNGSSQPAAVTLSAALDAAIGSTRGAVLERGSSGWAIITPGTSGKVFTSNGAGADPSWLPAPIGTLAGTTITGPTTLTSGNFGTTTAVTGAGYAIQLPNGGLTTGANITLVAGNGAGPIDICPSGGTGVFDTASGVALVPNICVSGQPGVVLYNGLQLALIAEAGGAYLATMADPSVQVNPQAYFASSTIGSDSNPGTINAPFLTVQACVNAAQNSSIIKTCYVRAGKYTLTAPGSCFSNSYGVLISSSNVTLSYYPPDGIGSPILDGSTNNPSVGVCISPPSGGHHADNVTVTGLTIRNVVNTGVRVAGGGATQSADSALITWNSFYNLTGTGGFGGGVEFIGSESKNSTVSNNFVFNAGVRGYTFTSYDNSGNALSGLTVSNNIAENSCTQNQDCGGIYLDDNQAGCHSSNVTVTNNYVDGTGAAGGGSGLYMDDGMCNVTSTYNVLIGNKNYCFLIHGGNNDIFQYNICDLGGAGGGSTNTQYIIFFQQDSLGNAMTGNVVENNLIVCNSSQSPCGGGYVGSNSPPNPLTRQNNGYHNYGSGTGGVGGVNVSCSGSACSGTETGRTSITSPGITCWNTLIASNSPLYNSPLSWPADLGRAWSIPQQVGPSQSQYSPSWGPSC